MRRSMIFTALLDLEPVEFGRMEQAPIDRAGAVISKVCDDVSERHPNQYTAVREWLEKVPGDRESGWLSRYADTLL